MKNEIYDAKTGNTTIEEREDIINSNEPIYDLLIKIEKKKQRLTELTKDFAQVQAGFIIDDIEERKAEFRTLLNEVRELQGKEPRKTNN